MENITDISGTLVDSTSVRDERVDKALFFITIIMMISGCLGNILVIGAVVAHKPLRLLHNTFIVNLAMADLMVSSVVNASGLSAVATDGLSLVSNSPLCEFFGIVCITACISSVLNIAGISINRYVKICHGKHYPKIYNRRTVPWIVVGLWTISFLIDLPNILGWGNHAFSYKFMQCTYVQGYSTYSYTFFFFLVGFMAPWVASGVAYLKIYLFIRKSSRNLKKSLEGQPQASGSSKPAGINETRILTATFTIWLMFLIMWSPYALTILFDRNHEWSKMNYAIAMIFAHFNSSINGIVYGVTNKQFRTAYWKLLTCSWHRGVQVDSETSGTKTTSVA